MHRTDRIILVAPLLINIRNVLYSLSSKTSTCNYHAIDKFVISLTHQQYVCYPIFYIFSEKCISIAIHNMPVMNPCFHKPVLPLLVRTDQAAGAIGFDGFNSAQEIFAIDRLSSFTPHWLCRQLSYINLYKVTQIYGHIYAWIVSTIL